MTGMERFDRWARLARREAAPAPDVAAAVLERIRRVAAPEPGPGLVGWILGSATAAAALWVGSAGLSAWLKLGEWSALGMGILGGGWPL